MNDSGEIRVSFVLIGDEAIEFQKVLLAEVRSASQQARYLIQQDMQRRWKLAHQPVNACIQKH